MFNTNTVQAVSNQTVDFVFSKHKKTFRDGCNKKEKKYIENQRNLSLKVKGSATIPAQWDIKDCNWLMHVKDQFEKDSNRMHQEWLDWKAQWEKAGLTPQEAEVEFLEWYSKWHAKGITIIGLGDDESFGKHKSFDTVDLRLWKVIYKKDWAPSKKKQVKGTLSTGKKPLLEHLQPVARACYENLMHILPKQDKIDGKPYFPELNEISFLSWGTVPQPMHCDFIAESETKHPTVNPLNQWYGSAIYHFVKKDLPLEFSPESGWGLSSLARLCCWDMTSEEDQRFVPNYRYHCHHDWPVHHKH